jgi:hypothetical protein
MKNTGYVKPAFDQGVSVALSADGNTALVGLSGDNTFIGAAWVFTRTNGVWSQQGNKLVGTGYDGGSGVRQGTSVALSADGTRRSSAARLMTSSSAPRGSSRGAAASGRSRAASSWARALLRLVRAARWLSLPMGTRRSSAASWTIPTAAPRGPSRAAAASGASRATSSSGRATSGSRTEAARSLSRPTAIRRSSVVPRTTRTVQWPSCHVGLHAQRQRLEPAGRQARRERRSYGSSQGSSVALSADGNTALIGGPIDNGELGATWVFTRSGSIWTQQGIKLLGTNPIQRDGVDQGASVALSADAKLALVGGPHDDNGAGAAWFFLRPCQRGDSNGSGSVDVVDVFYLINFLFANGAAPVPCS